MAKTVELTTRIAAPPEVVLRHVMTPRLLDHVAAPMIRFSYPPSFDRAGEWPLGKHCVTMRFMGIIPIGWQVIGIEVPDSPDKDTHLLRDNGYGPLIRRWDHWIAVRPDPSGSGTLYTDRVHIDAGLLTPVIAAYAKVFYAHRQKRWRELAADGFAALRG
ncbi:hypothetical protein CD351_02355 [Erythrobacter sp. KY5]|uniref:hypothetical protein n=1 Tax=Erythrobacter sp. KY5 TaxID=2011159 RepID=UPI000DBF0000|nr:hypothetical protein [Erythrobacter sp. KY5]AWW73265.1 hypothetical protein CD351_02355 [Erythrobacter sp. KY5]